MTDKNRFDVEANKYFYDINFVRAIAALCVVMVHVTAANYHLNDKHLNDFLLFFNQITRFGTPFFAVISGFLLYNQAIKGNYRFKKFLYSRFTKVFIPFVIWSFTYLFVNSYSFSTITDIESLKLFLYDFFLGKSSYHLYFIAVVIQFYFIFPIVQKFNSKKQLLFLMIVSLYINYFYLLAPLDIGSGLLNSLLKERAILFYWIFYFFLGGFLVHVWHPLVSFIKKNIWFVISLGVMSLLFITYDYLKSDAILGSTRMTNLINVPILFMAFTALYYLLDLLPRFRNIILTIGNFSMGIYLVHPLVIHLLREKMTWMLERTIWIPLAYTLTVLLSILIVQLIHKLPFGQYVVIIASRKKRKKTH